MNAREQGFKGWDFRFRAQVLGWGSGGLGACLASRTATLCKSLSERQSPLRTMTFGVRPVPEKESEMAARACFLARGVKSTIGCLERTSGLSPSDGGVREGGRGESEGGRREGGRGGVNEGGR